MYVEKLHEFLYWSYVINGYSSDPIFQAGKHTWTEHWRTQLISYNLYQISKKTCPRKNTNNFIVSIVTISVTMKHFLKKK